jgi:hypothetical protein
LERKMADDEALNRSEAEQRAGEERRREERRKENIGPPPGLSDRRAGDRRLFDRRNQGSTTGQLLVEVGRFAAENMVFRQKGNKAAARRARKHLSLIMKLAKQRRAEISSEMKGASSDATDVEEDAADETPEDSADE